MASINHEWHFPVLDRIYRLTHDINRLSMARHCNESLFMQASDEPLGWSSWQSWAYRCQEADHDILTSPVNHKNHVFYTCVIRISAWHRSAFLYWSWHWRAISLHRRKARAILASSHGEWFQCLMTSWLFRRAFSLHRRERFSHFKGVCVVMAKFQTSNLNPFSILLLNLNPPEPVR